MKKTLILCLATFLLATFLCACGAQTPSQKEQTTTTYKVEVDGETYYVDSQEEVDRIIYEHTTGLIDQAFENFPSDSPVYDEPMLEITAGGYEGFSYGYHDFYFKVKNISSVAVNTITININILDKDGDIADTTHPQEPATLEPGQAIYIEALNDGSRGAVAAVVDSYSLYDAQDNYCKGSIHDSPIVEFKS